MHFFCLLPCRRQLAATIIGLLGLFGSQSGVAGPAPGATGVSFLENKNQWPAAVRFKASVPGGDVYLGAGGFVYDWHSAADLRQAHAAYEKPATGGRATTTPLPPAATMRGHAVFVDFVGARPAAEPVGEEQQAAHHNYFQGNEPARWARDVRSFGAVAYPALYAGVALRVYGTAPGSLKYDFLLAPGVSPAPIALRYRGATALALRPDGALLVRTSVTDVLEQKPYAYQPGLHGERQAVACRYRLSGSTVRYEFPQGYDPARPLVIDPTVVACTYSGGTGETWGAATTHDAAGNLYTAGLAQTGGYPVTPGAYQRTFAGNQDIAISKLSPTGSQLLYATYLGSNGSDAVSALHVSAAGELHVLAQTSAFNFPTTPQSYRPTGSGVVVARLSASGNALLASTYLAGGSDAGVALATTAAGDVVVTGTTSSPTFPTTVGAYNRTLGGGQDIFVTSLDRQLTRLNWSTLLGSPTLGQDRVLDLAIAPDGDVVVGGSAIGRDFPTTADAARTQLSAPSVGFVTRLRADGTALRGSTLFGGVNCTNQVAKVAFDNAGTLYLAGNCVSAGLGGVLEPTPGTTSVRGGVWFVASLTPKLTAVRLVATPASASHPLLITALGVDQCGNMHVGGFVSGPNNAGLPIRNPLPNGTSGGIYLMTLNPAATAVVFGSYFGLSFGAHAHTPSHSYSPAGVFYQSVCTFDRYPTTPQAFAPNPRAGSYDVLALKIDAGVTGSTTAVQAAVAAVDSACAPFRVTFANITVGSREFRWDFADGSPADTARTPTHVFQAPGRYRVRLVALATAGASCGARNDTAYVLVRVKARPVVALPQNLALCANSTLTISAAGAGTAGTTYRWSTGATTPSISVSQPGRYAVTVDNGRCTARDSTTVQLVAVPTLTADTTACADGGLRLRTKAEPGSTYLWSTQETTASILAPTSGRYSVRITQRGCVTDRAVNVTLLRPALPPNVITPNGDGKNDVFQPSAAQTIEPGTRLHLYTRWGRQVYASESYRNDWDATGQPAGLYYYVLENERFCTPRVKGWLEVVK